MRNITVIAAALGLVAAPVAAQSAARDTAPVEAESEFGGTGTFLAAVGVALIVATVILVTDDDDDIDLSVSP